MKLSFHMRKVMTQCFPLRTIHIVFNFGRTVTRALNAYVVSFFLFALLLYFSQNNVQLE